MTCKVCGKNKGAGVQIGIHGTRYAICLDCGGHIASAMIDLAPMIAAMGLLTPDDGDEDTPVDGSADKFTDTDASDTAEAIARLMNTTG